MPKIAAKKPAPRTREELASDPSLIRCYDKYGQEIFITREQWRDNILPGTLEKAWHRPEDLYGIVFQALNDEFFEEVVKASEQLHRIDTKPERGATVLGIVYMKTGRLDDAERVLKGYIKKHGEEGSVLTNLAKVYSKRGLEEKSLETLWHALEVDPNQDNGMGWYEVIHRERDGKEAGIEALRRVAALSGSWRAQLWLARAALESGRPDQALGYYKESLAKAGKPVPGDLLMQMSGDLGNNGRLNQIIEWVEPHYNANIHGLQVGNNLIKAHLDLGNLDAAHSIIDKLYALKRPDWRDTLNYWDTELGKARIKKQGEPEQPEGFHMISIEGPLWMRAGSPFAGLLPLKAPGMQKVAVFGSTVTYTSPGNEPKHQMADNPGRLSRALPLLLTEWLHINTRTIAHGLIPWTKGKGFAVFGKPYDDADLCAMVESQKEAVDFVVGVLVDIVSCPWKIKVRLLRVADVLPLGTVEGKVDPQNPGPGVDQLMADFRNMIHRETDFRLLSQTDWYDTPTGAEGSDYLLRLEQQLAVTCMNMDFLKGSQLTGERDIIGGIIQHCARHPKNETARMLLVQTLRQMKKTRPEIMSEFKEKVDALQKEFPIPGEIGHLAASAIAEVFAV